MQIPEQGLSAEQIESQLEGYRAGDLRWRERKAFGYVYDAGDDYAEAVDVIGKKMYMNFLTETALDPTAYPSLLRIERELIAMTCSHLGGDEHCTGNFTSGGTESIMLAMKSARDHAKATRPEVTNPQMLLPTTAHAAFHKAAEYLGLERVLVPVDPKTWRADVDAMAAAITDQTVVMVGSAPSYAHGVIDPIEALGAVALERGVWLHVDACVGGFLLPYYARLGEDVPKFDLSVPGVNSISADLHKYAFCPKGASMVCYKNKALRKHQLFACAEWTGYTVVNNAVQSSKSGGPMAAAWAVLNRLGASSYLEIAKSCIDGTRKIIEAVESIEGLELLGDPEFCMFAVETPGFSVFNLVDEMKARGWHLQAQFRYQSSPANVHFSITPGNAHKIDAMIEDLRGAVEVARALPSGSLVEMVGPMLAGATPSDFTDEGLASMLKMVGVSPDALPERMAPINELLNEMPRAMTEKFLIGFFNELFVP